MRSKVCVQLEMITIRSLGSLGLLGFKGFRAFGLLGVIGFRSLGFGVEWFRDWALGSLG